MLWRAVPETGFAARRDLRVSLYKWTDLPKAGKSPDFMVEWSYVVEEDFTFQE
jgi:hypothetical protein